MYHCVGYVLGMGSVVAGGVSLCEFPALLRLLPSCTWFMSHRCLRKLSYVIKSIRTMKREGL